MTVVEPPQPEAPQLAVAIGAPADAPPVEGAAPPPAPEIPAEEDIVLPDGEVVPRSLAQEARNRYFSERGRRKEFETQLEGWGGPDAVTAALELQEALQTEQGVIDMFLEAGRALGLGVKELQGLFEGQAEGGEQLDEDQVLTLKEARALLEKEIRQPLQAQQQATERSNATRVVADTLRTLGVGENDDTAQIILRMGDKYLKEGDYNPERVAAAVRRGHADWIKAVETSGQEYLRKKAEAAAGVPKAPVGGGSPAPPVVEAPKSVDEAIKRVRERLRATAG